MAKKDETTRIGKSKMTVMVFQLEGNDQTLQDGIRTISSAISGLVQPRLLSVKTPAETNGAEVVTEPEVVLDTNDQPNIGEAVEEAKKPQYIRAPQILSDLKVSVDGLRSYCEQRKVGDVDADRYVAIAGYLKEQHQINAVTQDHIYTCYRLLNWNVPKDAGSPLRGLKRQGLFQKGKEKLSYELNHVGENRLRDMAK